MKESKPKIRVQNLVKIFGKHPSQALQHFNQGADRQTLLKTGHVLGVADVSFSIEPGELFVIMGLSGSGKSTLLRCLNRLITPTAGHVYLDDEALTQATEERLREIRRTRVTMVFQRFALFPHRTVVQNIAYGLKVRGVKASERRKKALEVLNTVGLDPHWADALPRALSGGMQQRVGLARALATDAEILLMDEAFSALDPLIRREMQDELMRLQAEFRKTIVFISHDIHEALKIGDRVAVMKDGALVQVATPETIVMDPADDYIAAFMKDVNRAQVLTTRSIMRKIPPFQLQNGSENGSIKAALDHLQQQERQQIYVVDQQHRPVGWVDRPSLRAALQEGQMELTAVMQTDFPKVSASLPLEAVFRLCQAGLPLTVVEPEGKLAGMIEPTDILVQIGR